MAIGEFADNLAVSFINMLKGFPAVSIPDPALQGFHSKHPATDYPRRDYLSVHPGKYAFLIEQARGIYGGF